MRRLSFVCLLIFAIGVLSWALPQAYELIALKPIEKTHLFYSPILQKCIFTEQIRGYDAEAAKKSEGHHADIVYKDESGVYYDRLAFEAMLPFIYYRNMQMRGLWPVKIGEQSFTRTEIERYRRVLELRATELAGKRPKANCLPLIESEPGQAALLYPDDRFSLSANAMVFRNADSNATDPILTERFTQALKAQGFVFPCRHIGGNFSNFKPYEGGIFLIDAQGALFHLLRKKDQPVCTKITLPHGLVPRHVLVSEAKEQAWLGLVLDEKDQLWLLRKEDFGLIGLTTPNYVSESMDCKIIFNPLFATAIYADDKTIYAQVFHLPEAKQSSGTRLSSFHSWQHTMSRASECWQSMLAATLFPFRLKLTSETSVMLKASIQASDHYWSFSLPFCFCLALAYFLLLRRRGQLGVFGSLGVCATFCAGLYALLPLLLLDERS